MHVVAPGAIAAVGASEGGGACAGAEQAEQAEQAEHAAAVGSDGDAAMNCLKRFKHGFRQVADRFIMRTALFTIMRSLVAS